MSKSFLEVDGIYNPLKRFEFTNILDREFVSKWNNKEVKIPAGAKVELPHHLAVKFAIEIVDQLMNEEAAKDQHEGELKVPTYRSRLWGREGVPMNRKPYEDKVLRELPDEPDTLQGQILRSQVKEQLVKDFSAQPSTGPITAVAEEFADLGERPPVAVA